MKSEYIGLWEKENQWFISKTQKQLAKEIGCNASLISHYLKRIKTRGDIYAK